MVSLQKQILLSFIILFLVSKYALPQEQEEKQIEVKQTELSSIKNEIGKLEEDLKNKTEKEKQTYSTLENLTKQNHLLNKLISKIKEEEKKKEKEINFNQKKIRNLENEISELKENYAKSIKSIYKYGKVNKLEALVDANSVQQAILRLKYLQRYSEQRENDVDKLEKAKTELIETRNKLREEKKEKEKLLAQKKSEEKTLNNKVNEREKILTSIKNDKKELRKELEIKKDAAGKIKNLITKLIEEAERKKREEAERLARLERERKERENNKTENLPVTETPEYNVDLNTSNLASFSSLKGRMIWPINNGKVIRKFGENLNNKLNTVTLNYGVDIKAGNDLNVKAVGEGVVSAIDYIPGYGSVIIITHKDDFRTVYSHLSEIFVKEGDKVKQGSIIAKIGTSIDGNVLHFEIWNERNNQNPEVWLVKR